mgnify:CR=1 FL=1
MKQQKDKDPAIYAPCGCRWKKCGCRMLSCTHINHTKSCEYGEVTRERFRKALKGDAILARTERNLVEVKLAAEKAAREKAEAECAALRADIASRKWNDQ